MVWYGMCSMCGVVFVMWYVWCGVVEYGMVWYDMACYSVVLRYGVLWFDLVLAMV